MSINETVLEMHYKAPLFDLFRETFGLGGGHFNFYKYSPQKECFVGFDQAFVQSEVDEERLFRQLKNSAMKNGYHLNNFFLGYFLQFKVVKVMQKRNRQTPQQINSRPHYRVSLDTRKNLKTGFSQHELLYNLNRNNSAFVYYACPMLFDRTDLYQQNPDLELLRLAGLSACPSIYDDNESHYIYYDQVGSDPVWCSDPVIGDGITPREFYREMNQSIGTSGFLEKQIDLLDFLTSKPSDINFEKKEKPLELLADSLTIVSYSEERNA